MLLFTRIAFVTDALLQRGAARKVKWRHFRSVQQDPSGLNADYASLSESEEIQDLVDIVAASGPLPIKANPWDLLEVVPIVLWPESGALRGGRILAGELEIIGTGGAANFKKFRTVAIDAIGTRILIRFFPDGMLEAIAFSKPIESTHVLPTGSTPPGHCYFILTPFLPKSPDGTFSLVVDSGRLFDFERIPSNDDDFARLAADIFWNQVNPQAGHPFYSLENTVYHSGGNQADVEATKTLLKMAIHTDPCFEHLSVDVEIATTPSGLARISGLSAASPSEDNMSEVNRAMDEFQTLCAAIAAKCTHWIERTTSVDPVALFSIHPTKAIEPVAFTVSDRDWRGRMTGHEVIEEARALQEFWVTHRNDREVRNAISRFKPHAVTALDRRYLEA